MNSVSIELLLQLLGTSSALGSDCETVSVGEIAGGWNKDEEDRKELAGGVVVGGLNKEK